MRYTHRTRLHMKSCIVFVPGALAHGQARHATTGPSRAAWQERAALIVSMHVATTILQAIRVANTCAGFAISRPFDTSSPYLEGIEGFCTWAKPGAPQCGVEGRDAAWDAA